MTTTTTENFPIMKGEASMARGADPHFEVPLFSHVIDNLWQGCSPAEFPDVLEEEGSVYYLNLAGEPVQCKWLRDATGNFPRFDKILNLYQWGEYVAPQGTEVVTVLAYDGSHVDMDFFDKQADQVIEWLHFGDRVLVHCQAGLNRSSMVVARVLMKEYGFTADEAIDHIRESRSPLCLCNDNFRQALKGLT